MVNYKILIFDKSNMTATIQFEGEQPYNYDLPLIDGKLPMGDALDFWIQTMYCMYHPGNRLAGVDLAAVDTSTIEGLVDPVPWPVLSDPAAQSPQNPVTTGLNSF